MKVKKSTEVVEDFFKGEDSRTGNYSLSSKSGRLFSYNTCIGEWYKGKLYVNLENFSITTSKHQGFMLSHIDNLSQVYVAKADSVYQDIQALHDCKFFTFEDSVRRAVRKFKWYKKYLG